MEFMAGAALFSKSIIDDIFKKKTNYKKLSQINPELIKIRGSKDLLTKFMKT